MSKHTPTRTIPVYSSTGAYTGFVMPVDGRFGAFNASAHRIGLYHDPAKATDRLRTLAALQST